MLKTPGFIIPLFYHVNPSDVRYPEKMSSPYREAFIKHYCHPERYAKEEIDSWRIALRQICSRSGWSTDLTQGYEDRLVKMVVTDLLKTFDGVPVEVARHPVGLDTAKNCVVPKLKLNSVKEVIKVGIWGIGGIGKTTLAKAVYNELYTHFEAASFIFNVRATAAETRGLQTLQEQILHDFIRYDRKVVVVEKAIPLFRSRLGGKRVLLILDDVDAVQQLNALLGNWLAPGSRVIITSRNQHIFNVAGCQSIHEMSGLEKAEGIQLFSWYALHKAFPSPECKIDSERIVEACKGHPLSIEEIGTYLSDKPRDLWKEVLGKGNIALKPTIRETLYISYIGLSDHEKDIFVDIVSFFIGENKRFPIVFWKSLRYNMVENALVILSMKLLIKIDDRGVFQMHSHLQEMGWDIAKKEERGSRERVVAQGIISKQSNFSRLWISGNSHTPVSLIMLCGPFLQFLHMQDLPIEEITEGTLARLPPSLIWLRLTKCGIVIKKRKAITKMFRAIGKYVGNIGQSKKHNGEQSSKLQILDLSYCSSLRKLRGTIANLSWLQHLNLQECGQLCKIPSTIGNLSKLQQLNLEGCRSLNKLPDKIGNLSQLKQLNLGGCEQLNELPDTIGNLSQLEYLNLQGCKHLNELPCPIGYLSHLQDLNLEGCRSLEKLPYTIDNLSQLQHLNLECCEVLHELPRNIGKLSQLQRLNLRKCENINSLPETVGDLSKIQYLSLEGCCKFNKLPYTIGKLSQLKHLNLGECCKLNELPHSIGNLSQLKYLKLEGCWGLRKLPDTIRNLSKLENSDFMIRCWFGN